MSDMTASSPVSQAATRKRPQNMIPWIILGLIGLLLPLFDDS